MRWWRIASNPHVVRAGGIWAVFKQLRLANRLLRDERVPMLTKTVLPATLVYLPSPLDLIPAIISILGQVNDIGPRDRSASTPCGTPVFLTGI